MKKTYLSKQAFTLLELLLVIAIVAALAGIILVALNPAQRLEEVNQAKYLSYANDIEKALEIYAVENGGNLPASFNNLEYGYYDICNYGESLNCLNIDDIVPTYLPSIPTDSNNSTTEISGFKLKYDPSKKEIGIMSNSEFDNLLEVGDIFDENLIGYWKMDEISWSGASGEVIDSSGNSLNGTSVNSPSIIPGKFGNAGDFSGADYVNLGSSSIMNIPGSVTQSAWIRISSAPSSTSAILRWISNSNIMLRLTTTRKLDHSYRGVSNWTNIFDTGSLSVNLNEWTHVAIVRNNSLGKIFFYYNGELSGTSDITDPPTSTSNTLVRIGGVSDSSQNFNGYIDELRLYDRALTSSEVEGLYNWSPSPIAHWKFDEGSGTTINDSTGNNTGVLSNSAWISGKFNSGLQTSIIPSNTLD